LVDRRDRSGVGQA
jgi:indole-3-acetate monooxygenase